MMNWRLPTSDSSKPTIKSRKAYVFRSSKWVTGSSIKIGANPDQVWEMQAVKNRPSKRVCCVNHHIRSVADRFAALGYVAIAPALFDRIEAGFESGYSPEEVQSAMRFVANPPMQAWMLDVAAAREAIADVGKIAVTGFCLGGTLTYGAATNLPGFSVAVGYYGGQIVRMAEQSPKVPTMLHFGRLGAHIPLSHVEPIKSKQPSVDV